MTDSVDAALHAVPQKRPWLGIACAALLIATGAGALLLRSRAEEPIKFCAGVGLPASDSSTSPETAFSRWLATRPEQPPFEQWQRVDGDSGIVHPPEAVVFANRTDNGRYAGGYATVSLVQGGWNLYTGEGFPADEWSVHGACVGYPS